MTEGAGAAARRVAWATGASRGVGRGIAAALAGDPDVLGLTGQALSVDALAAGYGIDVSS